MKNNICLIIPAGGIGSRMKSDIPKQYIQLQGKKIIEHTIDKFINRDDINSIIIVADEKYQKELSEYMEIKGPGKLYGFAKPGETRFDSVYNCIELPLLKSSKYTLVHDSVRPFVSKELIDTIIEELKSEKSVVPFIDLSDTIKQKDYHKENQYVFKTLDRSILARIQTPQGFLTNDFIAAYKYAKKNHYCATDDSSIMEYFGIDTKLVNGDKLNFKITSDLDLEFAKFLINNI